MLQLLKVVLLTEREGKKAYVHQSVNRGTIYILERRICKQDLQQFLSFNSNMGLILGLQIRQAIQAKVCPSLALFSHRSNCSVPDSSSGIG